MTHKEEYWIIDTGEEAQSQGSHTASGPYPSRKAAESHIKRDHKQLWEESCTCLKNGTDIEWCKPLLIVRTVRKVSLEITANIKLIDAP
jgi:hypothetical protein